MNAAHWIERFEQNRNHSRWDEPMWGQLRCELNDAARLLLIESLATFQLGESGGGTRLRRFVETHVSTRNNSSNYLKAIDLFIAEEQRHAKLLARAVHYLGGELKTKHWINSIFRGVRSRVNAEFNIQVLLIAELIAEAYYGLLYQNVPDHPIRSLCGEILRDEIQHVAFHRDFFREVHGGRLPITTAIWALQFQAIFAATEVVVWADHGKCLHEFGVTRREFQGKARGCCRRFLLSLQSQRNSMMDNN